MNIDYYILIIHSLYIDYTLIIHWRYIHIYVYIMNYVYIDRYIWTISLMFVLRAKPMVIPRSFTENISSDFPVGSRCIVGMMTFGRSLMVRCTTVEVGHQVPEIMAEFPLKSWGKKTWDLCWSHGVLWWFQRIWWDVPSGCLKNSYWT